MAYRCSGRSNEDLVNNLHREGLIRSDKVFRAFLSIDRGHFLPLECREKAYADEAVHAEPGHFHLSAPHMYATVMEALELTEGLSFLNIGSGTGYLSYLVAKIVGPFNYNHGIEQHKELVQHAATRCAMYEEYRNLNYIRFRQGDAFSLNNGEDSKTYDRIYVGGGIQASSSLYFREFLNIGGLMVAPREEELVCIQRISPENFVSKVITSVRFENLKEPDLKASRVIRKIDLVNNEQTKLAVSTTFGISVSKTRYV